MPRLIKPPRLMLDATRGVWIIRDAGRTIRTGAEKKEVAKAERALERYIGKKHVPETGPDPLIADVLLLYLDEHVPHTKDAVGLKYNIKQLAKWWGDKRLSDVTSANARAYAATLTPGAARKDLETLRAALRHWNRERGPIAVPAIVMPPAGAPRERWLTRSEFARLLWAARRETHLKRLLLIGWYTGSRREVLLKLTWAQIDFRAGIMARRAAGEPEDRRKRTPPVRIGRKLLAHLRRWRRLDGPHARYVCARDGKVLGSVAASFPTAIKRAGLTGNITMHTLRHSRATHLMRAGVDPWEAAQSLGMSVAMITRVYGHHRPDWQKRAAEV